MIDKPLTLEEHATDDAIRFARIEARLNLLILMMLGSGVLTVLH